MRQSITSAKSVLYAREGWYAVATSDTLDKCCNFTTLQTSRPTVSVSAIQVQCKSEWEHRRRTNNIYMHLRYQLAEYHTFITFQVCNFMHILARLFTLSTRKVQWLCYFDMFFLVHQECSSNADWCYWHKRVRIWEKGQNTLWVLLLGRLCGTRIDCCILPSPPADRLDSALSTKYCLLRAGGRGLSWHGWTTIHGFST